MSAYNGIDSGKNIKLQTVAWLWQAYNCLLQLNNDSLQANKDIDVVNNARLQAGKRQAGFVNLSSLDMAIYFQLNK